MHLTNFAFGKKVNISRPKHIQPQKEITKLRLQSASTKQLLQNRDDFQAKNDHARFSSDK